MKRFIVLVLDGFGIGAMADAATARPGDEVSSTLGSILKYDSNFKLKNLEKLGLMNAYGHESGVMKFSNVSNTSKCALMHDGADTFCGHQEIMGTIPQVPVAQPFQEIVDELEIHLKNLDYQVERITRGKLSYLLVNGCVCIGDNIDADLGMAYNLTAPLDAISFEEEYKIAKEVRKIAKVNRVIPFGGTGNTIEDILAAEEIHGDYIGIHAVKSKSYQAGYQVLHLGYGVDESVQAPTILTSAGIDVSLFGKVADIVTNTQGKSISCVNTAEVMDLTIQELKTMKNGFICTNVQETDLAGHSQDPAWYKELLLCVDEKLDELLPLLTSEDILVICADHGNDPLIGHNRHTRENVPLLMVNSKIHGIHLPLRQTLSDIGASVCDYFDCKTCANGHSFLKDFQLKD